MRYLTAFVYAITGLLVAFVGMMTIGAIRDMPDLHSLLKQPDINLMLADISFSLVAVWTYTGKTWARFYGWVYRAKEPKHFWWLVAIYFLGGVFFLARYLYEVS